MENDRKGSWIQTYTGKKFWPFSPLPDDVDFRDVAHALSNLCRFGGHCREFYSVAEHSIRACNLIDWDDHPVAALAALLHDASEAFLVDLTRPLKHGTVLGAEYRSIEHSVQLAINSKIGLPPMSHHLDKVVSADETMLVTEARDLMGLASFEKWSTIKKGVLPLKDPIMPMSPAAAKRLFQSVLENLVKRCAPFGVAQVEVW